MIATKHDIIMRRNATYEQEFIPQVKMYLYDPTTNNSAEDIKRTHAENLKQYGFYYDYINCSAVYKGAEIIFRQPWAKAYATSSAFLSLDVADGAVILTSNSIKLNLSLTQISRLTPDTVNYSVKLTRVDDAVDIFIYGTITMIGDDQ